MARWGASISMPPRGARCVALLRVARRCPQETGTPPASDLRPSRAVRVAPSRGARGTLERVAAHRGAVFEWQDRAMASHSGRTPVRRVGALVPRQSLDSAHLECHRYSRSIAWVPRLSGAGQTLVGRQDEALAERPYPDQLKRPCAAGLAEEPLPRSEDDREDDQPQLVDQIVLHQ